MDNEVVKVAGKATAKQEAKVHKVMSEFKAGTLKSSSGGKVTSRSQAIAIAMHSAGLARDNPGHGAKKKKHNPSCFGGFTPGTWLSQPTP